MATSCGTRQFRTRETVLMDSKCGLLDTSKHAAYKRKHFQAGYKTLRHSQIHFLGLGGDVRDSFVFRFNKS